MPRTDRNVLLIVMDSVRAQNLSLYGHYNDTSPFLEEFSNTATVYTQARSPGIWSLPSHASMFTGYDVNEHGVTNRERKLRPGTTVWERLQTERDYATSAFTGNAYVNEPTWGLSAGFDTVVSGEDERWPFPAARNPHDFSEVELGGWRTYVEYAKWCYGADEPTKALWNGLAYKLDRSVVSLPIGGLKVADDPAASWYIDEFLQWERGQDGPWGAFINLLDAHSIYRPTPPNNKWADDDVLELAEEVGHPRWQYLAERRPLWELRALEALYDGAIYQMDSALRHLIRTLDRRGVLDKTLVIVSSDHGEGFGERSRIRPETPIINHFCGIHEALVHVPLVVKYPGQKTGKQVESLASTKLVPTAVEQSMSDSGPHDEAFVPDRPVVAASRHEFQVPQARTHHEELLDEVDLSPFAAPAHAYYTETDDGLIHKNATWGDNGAGVLSKDPQHAMRISDGTAEEVRSIFKDIVDRGVSEPVGGELSERTERRLRDLGYR